MASASPKNRPFTWVEAALGKRPCDFILRDAVIFDVFACRWLPADIAVFDGRIVGLEPGLKAKREISARGKFVVPGFIDAHVHLESSMLAPENFQRAVLPHGTTTAICDPHELANVQGVPGIQYFLKAAEKMVLDLRVMISSCVPATDFETNGAGHLSAKVLLPLRAHAKALGLAEMMNVPGLLRGDKEVWDKLRAFDGAVLDGHCPLLSGRELSAYAAAGISSCHESTRQDEAAEKLTKGLAVWIREGSVAKDLNALAPLLTIASSARIGFCTDDRNPLDIANEGHIDFLVRRSIALGVPMEAAYRAASWTVARHYGLSDRGAIAPGYRADLVVLGDRESCGIDSVWVEGKCVSEIDLPTAVIRKHPNTIKARAPQPEDLVGPSGRVHLIGVERGKILTSRSVDRHDAPGVARLSVLERYGHKTPPANAYVRGFGLRFRGAIASSVGHDSHNLIVVGSNTDDMAVALKALIASGGGYCVAEAGEVRALLALPLGGLMSDREAPEIRDRLAEMHKVCQSLGCELPEPFLQLAFLSLPVIPSLKLTDQGLVDVDAFKLISVSAA
jgi:adenine deaminase